MKGIDVSSWQGQINWEAVKSQIDFAILRLGYIGNNENSIDSQFERNYSECKRLNIPIGVYVYCYARTVDRARIGANWVVDNLRGKTLELPVYIDMEDASIESVGRSGLTDIVIAFNTIIESSGRWAGVYANLNWFNNFLNKDEIKRRYTTWIAHYGVSEERYRGEYDMLQYSSSGRVSGINGNVDMNIMYRNLIEDIAGTTPEPPKKSNEEIADEVINGLWGNGEERRNRLTEAGYDYNTIQNLVNQKLGSNKPQYYTIKTGDTLTKIAREFNTTVNQLVAWNNITNANKIYAGQTIRVK